MQQGYESRHVASTVYIHSMMALMANEGIPVDETDKNWFIQPAVDATLACRLNPLAMTEVRQRPAPTIHRLPLADGRVLRQAVPVAHSLLTRCVHSGMISIVSCLIQALHVPVVPMAHLWAFFTEDDVRPPPPLRPVFMKRALRARADEHGGRSRAVRRRYRRCDRHRRHP